MIHKLPKLIRKLPKLTEFIPKLSLVWPEFVIHSLAIVKSKSYSKQSTKENANVTSVVFFWRKNCSIALLDPGSEIQFQGWDPPKKSAFLKSCGTKNLPVLIILWFTSWKRRKFSQWSKNFSNALDVTEILGNLFHYSRSESRFGDHKRNLLSSRQFSRQKEICCFYQAPPFTLKLTENYETSLKMITGTFPTAPKTNL